jgi:hypothetical protein
MLNGGAMHGHGGDAGDSGVYTIEQFRANSDEIIDRSLEGRRVVIESSSGRVAMVLSVGSFDDVNDDE